MRRLRSVLSLSFVGSVLQLIWLSGVFFGIQIQRGWAQATAIDADPAAQFKRAVVAYQHGYYAVAQQQFQDIIHQIEYFQQTNRALDAEDARYYDAVCALQLHQPDAEKRVLDFIQHTTSIPRKQLASFYLAQYYYRQHRYREAIPYYESAGIDQLSNDQIAEAKFQLGYCYFYQKDFTHAAPLFADVKGMEGPYQIPANYYDGFIAFERKQYDQALQSFLKVANQSPYDRVVPYYIAEIYYFQGKKQQAIDYALPVLQRGNNYYQLPLQQLVGQVYFELGDYQHALPYLQQYARQADSLRREDVYELSFCYYQTQQYPEAILGFKQLSTVTDSLGQNAMYLLGDCYLKTGQKADARNAFAICARSSYNPKQQEIARFLYGKLSYELGYQDAALATLRQFLQDYPASDYANEAREILVPLLMNTNDYKGALELYASLSNPSPSLLRAYQKLTFGRAMQLINDGQLSSADSLLSLSLAHPFDASYQALAYFWKGEIAYRRGQYDEAIQDIQQYLTPSVSGIFPALGEANVQTAHYNLGYCYLQKQDYANALREFQQAQRPYGAAGRRIAQDALLRTADSYYMLKQYDRAEAVYDQIINQRLPGTDYALYQKSILEGIKGNYTTKLQLLHQLTSQYPDSRFQNDANYEKGLTYMTEEKYAQAIPYFEKILATPQDPDAPRALLKLGLAYFNMGNAQRALDYYQQLVQQYPHSSEAQDALTSMRTIYINNGNPQGYLDFVKQAGISVSASTADSVTYAAAETQFGNENFTAALQGFNQYLAQFPDGQFVLPAHFYRAECYFMQKDYAHALPDYQFVLQQGYSRFAERSAAQAARISLNELKNYTQARSYFEMLHQLATTKENTLTAARGLLECDYQLQQWDSVLLEARYLLTRQDISTNDQITGNYYLAMAFHHTQQCDSAMTYFKKVVQMTKSVMGAASRYYIADCLLQQQQLKEAEKAAFEVIRSTPSYDYWIAKAYVLLGDIFAAEKDYFNAKATLQSVVDNCQIPEIRDSARQKLQQVMAAEQASSKIIRNPDASDTLSHP
ncbi:MAG: tetratricopeptide repeat protein [Thermoflavifilum sp.]|nr:tetratricopeptide repeat protein [Thermoflavifilum sp.]